MARVVRTMARVLVHALAATAGGGLTFLRNFLQQCAENGRQHQWSVLAPNDLEIPTPKVPHVRILKGRSTKQVVRRIYLDQITVRRMVREEKTDVILATGNFGVIRPPKPQVLLSRNALYFSDDYFGVLRRRLAFLELLNIGLRRRLALASIRDSAINIVPTQAMRDAIIQKAPNLASKEFRVAPHGYHRRCASPSTSTGVLASPDAPAGGQAKRILMVSHYNYYRNFETLLKAVALLTKQGGLPIELQLTTKLQRGVRDHRYDTSRASDLIDQLGIRRHITMLGTVPNDQISLWYQQADVVVCPSMVESFGHPLVEAMAHGCPVVASDLPVHREICGAAALYFPVFDAQALADLLKQVLTDPALAARLAGQGLPRSEAFSWTDHFQSVLGALEDARS